MRRVQATNVGVSRDDTGGLAKFDWVCPHCGMMNPEFIFSSIFAEISGDFEVDRECEGCGKTVTVECAGAEPLF